ncbi:hypothetical protein HPB47_011255 [Ixodes persulcatus]|uniref:Uncharacterized protein n=1 Tax=Ixodes persulcatus TaxID=34615 RepID=A0AC60NWT3_IXOPE|nr:hypothetical protein HPB47_011255 [Ixodes persulcatus]
MFRSSTPSKRSWDVALRITKQRNVLALLHYILALYTPSFSAKIPHWSQLLMVLMKLRLGLLNKDLSSRFDVARHLRLAEIANTLAYRRRLGSKAKEVRLRVGLDHSWVEGCVARLTNFTDDVICSLPFFITADVKAVFRVNSHV